VRPATIELIGLEGQKIRVPEQYFFLTCHREENTKNDDTLLEIFKAMSSLEYVTLYPVHPRNKERALRLKKEYGFENLILVEPVGYLESICLVNHAKKIVTDSGGLLREAFFAKKQCVSVLDHLSWTETLINNRNQLASPNADDILSKLSCEQIVDEQYNPFGDGCAAKKIVAALEGKMR